MSSPAVSLVPPSEASALRLDAFLPYRLSVLSNLTSNALAQIYAERFGLSIPGWRVIAILGQGGIRTARDVAAHGVMHKSTVSRAVAVLEKRGLVARRANPHDRREEILELTAEGITIYEAVAPEALRFEDRLKAALSVEECRSFMSLVRRLEDRARALSPGGASAPGAACAAE